MARFRGTLLGQRGQTSRLGNTHSGLLAEINAWTQGVNVHAFIDATGRECINVIKTGGSMGQGQGVVIARIVDGRIVSKYAKAFEKGMPSVETSLLRKAT